MAKKEKTAKDNKADFLSASKKAEKNWQKARTVDPGESMSQPEMDDGQYVARSHSMRYGKTGAGDPYVSWTFNVLEGENENDKPSKFYNLSKDSHNEQLSKDLQRAGFDIKDLKLAEVIDIAEEINKDKPVLRITVKNNESTVVDKKTKKKVTKNYLNLYVDRLLEDYEGPSDDDDDDNDEEEATFEKGATVTHKPKGAKKASEFTITKVNEDDETLDLKGEDGTKLKGVAFDKCELVEDEDEEEEEEDEDNEDEDEDEEDDAAAIEKGSTVTHKPKGAKKPLKYIVTKVDSDNETADLKDEDGNKLKGVPLDKCELVENEDEEDEEEDEDEGDDDEDSEAPEVGDAVKYKPKGKRKAVDCTIKKVNEKKQTADLKEDESGEVHKAVAFDDFEIQYE